MRWIVYLPLLLPITSVPVARLAADHLAPRRVVVLLTALTCVLALCATISLGLLTVVGTAQLPGVPLPDHWSDPQVRASIPNVQVIGSLAGAALASALVCVAIVSHRRRRALAALRAGVATAGDTELTVLPTGPPTAFALPGRRPRIVVSASMLARLDADERRALLAHERAHLSGRHDRVLLVATLAMCAHPLLRPMRTAIAYALERCADEAAARVVGDRRVVARAVGKAALAGPVTPRGAMAATGGPVPRRVAALLAPTPADRWPTPWSRPGAATLIALGGAALSTWATWDAAIDLHAILLTADHML
ncbi:M56 family metallopeptidase [Embleya sp. NPDC005971]|uniref:M56 family metallopeptidase n=1 Tax=Embleya sp. NPDC005971 TaxID=3156724 RepID=UPI0033CDE632